ncbi:MAG: YfcE family phosphodiesterase [Gammaproteobacteria bacterium]
MTTRLGIISDIHASPAPLKEALSIFKKQNVDIILCPGDIAGYGEELEETIRLLIQSKCKAVLGNHEIWYLEKNQATNSPVYQYIKSLPQTFELNIEGKKILMVHAHPPSSYTGGIRLLDQDGELDAGLVTQWSENLAKLEYDALIVGHTHQVYAETLAGILVINPGSSTYNHSCAMLTLPDLTVDFFSLSNQKILKS